MKTFVALLAGGAVLAAVAATEATTLRAGDPGTVTHGTTTVLVSDIPEDAAPYWPWVSVEDFFSRSGLSWADMTPVGGLECSSSEPGSEVIKVSDGKNDRCFVVIKPQSLTAPAPVVFFAHGSGGSAANCAEGVDEHADTWVKLAMRHNFIYVCGEAVIQSATNNITGKSMQGGTWNLPEVFNDTSGRQCDGGSGSEAAYMQAVWAAMAAKPDEFDLTRRFVNGCSEGSAFSQWHAVCLHESDPTSISAFITHSTGLKIKGDGNTLPPCSSDPSYTWGECPTCKCVNRQADAARAVPAHVSVWVLLLVALVLFAWLLLLLLLVLMLVVVVVVSCRAVTCVLVHRYWPTVPGKFDGLKACINDNFDDPSSSDPFFYKTSVQMAKYYAQFGSRYNTTFLDGGHCKQHSFEDMAACLDDGTGRLLGKPSTNCTDVAPDTNYTCAQQLANGHCSKPWMDGHCCKTCFNCSVSCSN
jgi:hypothetical protein